MLSPDDPSSTTEHAETHGFSWTTEAVIKKHIASFTQTRSDEGVAVMHEGTVADHGSIALAPNPAALHLMTSFYRFSVDDVYGSFRRQVAASSSSSSSSSSSASSGGRDMLADYNVLQSLQNETWCKDKVQEGVRVARDGRYELSIELCSNALSLYPDSVDGLVCRAASYANLSKFDLAIRDFQRALELDPTHENAKEYLAKVLAKWEQRTAPPGTVLPAEPAELRSSSSSSSGGGGGGGGIGRVVPIVPSKVKVSGEAVGVAGEGVSSSGSGGGGGGGAKGLTINGYSFVADDDDDDEEDMRRRAAVGDGTTTRIRKRAPSTASSDSDDASSEASASPSDSGSSTRSKKRKHKHKKSSSSSKHKKSSHKKSKKKHRSSKKHKKEKGEKRD
jgi:hypothetical protein